MPAIARATALAQLGSMMTESGPAVIDSTLRDPAPVVRMAALRAMEGLPPADRLRMALPLLSDPIRTVRIEAVRALVTVPPEAMNQQQRALFLEGVEEYRLSQMVIAERPEAHLNLGWLEVSQGNASAAEQHYEQAVKRDPTFIPAFINLADLYRMQSREEEGEEQLRRALALDPDVAELHHSLGLLLVRRNQHEEALASLAQAVELAPDTSRFHLGLGLLLRARGQDEEALRHLRQARSAGIEIPPDVQGWMEGQ